LGLLDKLFSKRPSRNDFANLVIETLAQAGVSNVRYQEADFSMKIGDGDHLVFLANGYANFCNADKSERKGVIAQFASAIVSTDSMPEDYASAKTNLMPVVRDASYYAMTQLHRRARNTDHPKYRCPTKPLVGDLVMGLAYDTASTILQVNEDHLLRWGVTFEEAFKEAKNNLRERTNPNGMTEEAPGLYLGRWGDAYDSTRMLFTDIVYRLSVSGEPVAFAPNRDQFWVTGTGNVAAIGTILKIGEQSHFAAHPLSPSLFVLSEGAWKIYVPEDPALLEPWLSMKRRREAMDYAQQKEYLDAIHERQKIDVFVASYTLFTPKEGGTEYSACVWSNGADSLLPKAENIVFLMDQKKKDYVSVPWEAALSIVCSLVEQDPSLQPIRFRVRSFPNQEQIAELRRVAVP
jgi:hypothetical protein